VHLGPGVLFLDVSFSSDLTLSVFDYNGGDQEYKRSWVTLSVGYTFGLITKPIKERPTPAMTMKYFDEVR
jgi:CelD/BcsL family acetyltransferase involved in cellulose biosynthesis